MQIGIDLDNYKSPMEELENLVNDYGPKREVGFLKINPERLPVIISERKALADMEKYNDHKTSFPVKDGKYEMITSDKAVFIDEGNLFLFANAYIAKKQGDVFTALNMGEILDWLLYLCDADLATKKQDHRLSSDIYLFELDKDGGYWK